MCLVPHLIPEDMFEVAAPVKKESTKQVRFADSPPKIIAFLDVTNYEEIKQAWYTEEEIKSIQERKAARRASFTETAPTVIDSPAKTEAEVMRSWYSANELAENYKENKDIDQSKRATLVKTFEYEGLRIKVPPEVDVDRTLQILESTVVKEERDDYDCDSTNKRKRQEKGNCTLSQNVFSVKRRSSTKESAK